MICIPKLALEIQDLLLPATVLSPRLDDRDDNPLMEEKYPPGTRVECIDPTTNMLLAGTVMDIPLHSDPDGLVMYLILFDNGTSASFPLADMVSLIPSPPIPGDGLSIPSSDKDSLLLPPFLQIGSCITYKHEGTYHKGFLAHNNCGLIVSASKPHQEEV
jgi:hypothetical protein